MSFSQNKEDIIINDDYYAAHGGAGHYNKPLHGDNIHGENVASSPGLVEHQELLRQLREQSYKISKLEEHLLNERQINNKMDEQLQNIRSFKGSVINITRAVNNIVTIQIERIDNGGKPPKSINLPDIDVMALKTQSLSAALQTVSDWDKRALPKMLSMGFRPQRSKIYKIIFRIYCIMKFFTKMFAKLLNTLLGKIIGLVK